MTIQQAIKSGKPFRRKRWRVGWWVEIKNDTPYWQGIIIEAHFELDAILAKDWEVKG